MVNDRAQVLLMREDGTIEPLPNLFAGGGAARASVWAVTVGLSLGQWPADGDGAWQ